MTLNTNVGAIEDPAAKAKEAEAKRKVTVENAVNKLKELITTEETFQKILLLFKPPDGAGLSLIEEFIKAPFSNEGDLLSLDNDDVIKGIQVAKFMLGLCSNIEEILVAEEVFLSSLKNDGFSESTLKSFEEMQTPMFEFLDKYRFFRSQQYKCPISFNKVSGGLTYEGLMRSIDQRIMRYPLLANEMVKDIILSTPITLAEFEIAQKDLETKALKTQETSQGNTGNKFSSTSRDTDNKSASVDAQKLVDSIITTKCSSLIQFNRAGKSLAETANQRAEFPAEFLFKDPTAIKITYSNSKPFKRATFLSVFSADTDFPNTKWKAEKQSDRKSIDKKILISDEKGNPQFSIIKTPLGSITIKMERTGSLFLSESRDYCEKLHQLVEICNTLSGSPPHLASNDPDVNAYFLSKGDYQIVNTLPPSASRFQRTSSAGTAVERSKREIENQETMIEENGAVVKQFGLNAIIDLSALNNERKRKEGIASVKRLLKAHILPKIIGKLDPSPEPFELDCSTPHIATVQARSLLDAGLTIEENSKKKLLTELKKYCDVKPISMREAKLLKVFQTVYQLSDQRDKEDLRKEIIGYSTSLVDANRSVAIKMMEKCGITPDPLFEFIYKNLKNKDPDFNSLALDQISGPELIAKLQSYYLKNIGEFENLPKLMTISSKLMAHLISKDVNHEHFPDFHFPATDNEPIALKQTRIAFESFEKMMTDKTADGKKNPNEEYFAPFIKAITEARQAPQAVPTITVTKSSTTGSAESVGVTVDSTSQTASRASSLAASSRTASAVSSAVSSNSRRDSSDSTDSTHAPIPVTNHQQLQQKQQQQADHQRPLFTTNQGTLASMAKTIGRVDTLEGVSFAMKLDKFDSTTDKATIELTKNSQSIGSILLEQLKPSGIQCTYIPPLEPNQPNGAASAMQATCALFVANGMKGTLFEKVDDGVRKILKDSIDTSVKRGMLTIEQPNAKSFSLKAGGTASND